jgi:hypothetical protein
MGFLYWDPRSNSAEDIFVSSRTHKVELDEVLQKGKLCRSHVTAWALEKDKEGACLPTMNATQNVSQRCTVDRNCISGFCGYFPHSGIGGRCFSTNLTLGDFCVNSRQCVDKHCVILAQAEGQLPIGSCKYPPWKSAKVEVQLEMPTEFSFNQLDSKEKREKFAQTLKKTMASSNGDESSAGASVAEVVITAIEQKDISLIDSQWCCLFAESADACSSGSCNRRRLAGRAATPILRVATDVAVTTAESSSGDSTISSDNVESLQTAGTSVASFVNSPAFSNQLESEVEAEFQVQLPEIVVEEAEIAQIGSPTPAPTPIAGEIVSTVRISRTELAFLEDNGASFSFHDFFHEVMLSSFF